MALSEYAKKRRFDKTPEPKAKTAKGKGMLRFVVQKHAASSLHYDFRLELDGVLKSWAVPKGPSLKPGDHHLAVHVEDHPFEYRNFEGVIPKGEYGAGNVIIWDEGTYVGRGSTDRKSTEKEIRQGLKKGHITFVVLGKKLKGEFALVKMPDAENDAWLLIKKGDEYASDTDVTKLDKSVRSGKSIEKIGEIKLPTKSKIPHDIKPMLCTLVDEAFDGEEWLFEIKWDGYRAIAEVDSGKVKLYSRNLLPFESKFPAVVEDLTQIKNQMVLDGEVVALDKEGRPSFQLLQDYAKTQKGKLIYYVFDLLYLNGHDTAGLSLEKRRELLAEALPKLTHAKLSDAVEKDGKAFFKVAKDKGLEGIVAKRKASIYQQGKRGGDWLKIKTHLRQEAVICGFTEPRASRQLFGALVLGIYEKGRLVYIGHAGGGFDGESLKALHSKMKPLIVKDSPIEPAPKTNEKATWVKPKLVCEVKFQEWTREGTMRQPIFLGMRPDKKPTEAKKELAK